MSVVTGIVMITGGLIAVLAAVGLLRFETAYARFHAAGKASPVAFLVTALGAGIELGPSGGALLIVASAAMLLTLPVGVHLLFRAVHRTTTSDHLLVDDLAPAKARSDR